jgi:hypothetical protein
MTLVVAQNPVAVIILAHFAVLMARARYAWWMKGWPQRILDNAVRTLEPTPELMEWLDWPRAHIETMLISRDEVMSGHL